MPLPACALVHALVDADNPIGVSDAKRLAKVINHNKKHFNIRAMLNIPDNIHWGIAGLHDTA